MISKGLCSTCAYDTTCKFPRKFPVIECEEFTTEDSINSKKAKKTK